MSCKTYFVRFKRKLTFISQVFLALSVFQSLTYPVAAFSQLVNESFSEKEEPDSLCFTQFGGLKVFFYANSKKTALSRQLVNEVNEKLLLTFVGKTEPCPPHEIAPLALKKESISTDPQGKEFLRNYFNQVKNITEDLLHIHLNNNSNDMRLIANQDTLKFYRPSLDPIALEFPSKYVSFQDTTRADWQSANGTFFATVIQPEGDCSDRFLLISYPGEISNTLYITSNSFTSFPFFSEVAPIDYHASQTAGSWKGKSITTTNAGFVLKEEVENATESTQYLPANLRKTLVCPKECVTWEYDNGISLKEIPSHINEKVTGLVRRIKNEENITLLEIEPKESTIDSLREIFEIKGELRDAFYLIKKGPGFSWLKKLGLKISPSSTVILINHSSLPTECDPFPVCEDYTSQDRPWIQMYRFPFHMAMKLSADVLENMALTPIEEILHRNALADSTNRESSTLKGKISSEISMYVFN